MVQTVQREDLSQPLMKSLCANMQISQQLNLTPSIDGQHSKTFNNLFYQGHSPISLHPVTQSAVNTPNKCSQLHYLLWRLLKL